VLADARIATLMFPTVTVAPAWRGFLTGRAAIAYDPAIFPDAVRDARLSVGDRTGLPDDGQALRLRTTRTVQIRPPCKASKETTGTNADSRVDQRRRELTKCSRFSLSPVAPRTVSPQALRAPGSKTASCS